MLLSIATDLSGLPRRPAPRNLRTIRKKVEAGMIVQLTGSAALARLMRGDRPASQHLAPAQMDQGGGQDDDPQPEAQPQRRLDPPRLGRQHVHRHLPREEDARFR